MRRGSCPLMSLALCLLPATTSVSLGLVRSPNSDPDFQTVDEYVTRRMRSAQLPGVALVIVKGDRIVFAKGYGRADASGRSVTPQTPFLIGSISKSFTALAVMQLVEAGKVELDAPVQRYVPWFRVADARASARITVRQLLFQTSGVPQPPTSQASAGDDPLALERSVRALATLRPVGPPGQSFAYSNGNYDTLGMIVQAVSGQSYERYVQERIFAPLDMRNSYVSQDEALRHGMASGYRWWLGIPIAAMLPYNRGDLPSGYIISSAEDMAHLLIAEMNGGRYESASVLSPDGIARTHVMPATPYGMGWETVAVSGHTLIDHDGGTPNFQASLFFDPKERVGVFIAANVDGALDAFASPAGADARDGPTTRAMALSVLSIVANRPLPNEGIGHRTLYLIYDVVLFTLTGALIISLASLQTRYRRLERRDIARSSRVWRHEAAAALDFGLPVSLLFLALKFPTWKAVVALYQPDLGYWLGVVALVLLLEGSLELAFVRRVAQARKFPT